MKKHIIKIFAIMVMVCCLFSLVACNSRGGKPELDLEKAAETLEEEGYSITHDEESSEIDVESYLFAIKGDDELTIMVFKTDKLAKLYLESIKLEFESEKELGERTINLLEYMLDHYEDELLSDEIDALEDTIKIINKGIKEIKKEYSYGRKGNIVWHGTADAVKDSKK